MPRIPPNRWFTDFGGSASFVAAVPTWDCLSIGVKVMAVEPRSTIPGAVLASVGVVLLLAAFVWMVIVGYYPSQLPIIIVMVVTGAVLAWLGQRMYQSSKRTNALQRIEQRDAERS